ncbi:MAG: alpha/beta hydrolase-fold protein, partial [Allomuricauda sp.]
MATKSYKGSLGSATVEIAVADGDCQEVIRNPLIVVEGFDSGLQSNSSGFGDTDLEYFLGTVNSSNSEALQDLISEDTLNDFDIIYVNWDNGTDYLQRNAYVLEEVIRWVNQNKETDAAPNVILGQSMGGVIARYALRDMENNNEDHDTSLYISHDAPHQGAHVPPGFFYMGRHLLNEALSTPIGGIVVLVAGGSVPAKEVRQMMDSPAAKQLLINYVTNDYEIDTDAFDAWQNELKVMGYPQQTRNIAISNGSHCAQTYGIEPSQNLLSLHGSASFSPFTDLALHIFDLGWLTGALLGDIPTIFLGKLFGQTSFHVGFDVWAFPEVGTEKIYNGWVDYEKKLLWVVPIKHNLTSRSKEWDGNGIRLDDYPGGALPFLNTLKEGEESESNFLFKYHYNLQVTEDVSFIPTTSALDVGSGNTTLVEEDFLQTYTVGTPLSPELAIPFDNYTTTHNLENVNEMHITFNTQSGDWLANELNNTATLFDCSFLCNNLELEGGNTICKEEVYSVNVVGNTQIEWSSSNLEALTPMDPNSPSTLFVTPPNTYHQQVTIFATLFSPSCGGNPVVLEKLVTVGAPGEPADLYGPTSVVTGGLVQYFGGPAVGATSYEWRLPFPFDKVDQFDLFSDNWQINKSATHYDSALVFTGYGKNAGYVQLMG